MTLKERVKSLADARGISLPTLEAELGFGNSTIVKWDKSIPNADKLNKVAKYFNVSMDYLLNGTDYEQTIDEKIADTEDEILHIDCPWLNNPNDPNYIKPSTTTFKGHHTPQDLQTIKDTTGRTLENILHLPELTYEEIKYRYIIELLKKENYALYTTGNELILFKNNIGYEINPKDYEILISSLEDYFSLTLKQLLLKSKKSSYSLDDFND